MIIDVGLCRVIADEIRSYKYLRVCRSGSLPRLCYQFSSMYEKPHGCDLRKGRVSLPGYLYLITAVTRQRQPLFKDINLGRIVVREMMLPVMAGDVESVSFVVMPDYFHWLIHVTSNKSVSSVVGAVKRHSARKINLCSGCNGRQVWQRGFHDHALRRDEEVARVARYIVANPLRAGLVKRIGDYPLWDAVWL